MIENLDLAEIVRVLQTTPEQTVFDRKRDFPDLRVADAKGEIVKDLMAIANGTAFTHQRGFIFYGVDPRLPDPIVGVTRHWDDANLQQLAASVLDPVPDFLLYEVDGGAGRVVTVLHVPRSKAPFHVVVRDVGKLRAGQSAIRQGSSTRWVTRDDHIRLYLTVGHGYAEHVLQRYGAAARMAQAANDQIRLLQQDEDRLLRQMEWMAGLRSSPLG